MKNVVKMISFLAVFVVLLFLFSKAFIPKDNSEVYDKQRHMAYGIFGEPKDSIDVLFIGDSLVYSGISPLEIWNEYGITSYDVSTPAQKMNESYSLLEKSLKVQKPKIVFLNSEVFYRKMTFNNIIGNIGKETFSIVKYHNRWKNITFSSIFSKADYTWSDELKGYMIFMNKKSTVSTKNYMIYNKNRKEIKSSVIYYANKIVDLCEKNNIKLVILAIPSVRYGQYERHNGVEEFAKKNQLTFLDLNLKTKEIGIEWKNDSRDKGDHLNYYGAVKVSKYIGKYINKLNMVPNHKNDSKYEVWNELYDKYQAKVESLKP